MLFQIPYVDLKAYSVTANNLEEPEIFLIAVTAVQVNERFRGAKSQYLVFFVKCNAQDVG